MKVIHLISDISRVNFGVWNVVVAVFPALEEMGWEPEIWFPDVGTEVPLEIRNCKYRIIPKNEVIRQTPEAGGQKSEVRGQKSEVRGQKSEVRDQKSEVRILTLIDEI